MCIYILYIYYVYNIYSILYNVYYTLYTYNIYNILLYMILQYTIIQFVFVLSYMCNINSQKWDGWIKWFATCIDIAETLHIGLVTLCITPSSI